MSFHSPHLLWLLLPLLLLFSWELARHTAATASVWPKIRRAWAGAFEVSLGTRHTTAETRPRIWLWFGLAACIIALARPQWGVIEEKVFDQSREVLIALDLSRSMLSTDVKPSRLERGKLLISSLLDGLKGERVGLVLFSGTAFLQSPLSADYEVLREFLPALKPDYLPEGGTNYKGLLETSMQAFGTTTADRYLIILSDGEATDDDWKPLVEQLKNKGIRVIGLGVGTTAGSFIPDGAGGFVKDERGAVVLSRLNSSTLQELAQLTGGAYSDASAWVDLPALLKQTVDAGKKGEFTQKNTARKIERFQWFLAPGLFLLFLSFWSEFPVRPRERALPLGKPRAQSSEARVRSTAAAAALVLVCALSALSTQLLAQNQGPQLPPAGEPSSDAYAAPLAKTVGRLAAQDSLSAKDCSELAQTTLTYGQRALAASQHPPEGVVRDALAGVDLGEKLDPKAADWPRVRQELKDLLKQQEEQKKKEEQKKQEQQQKQDQQKQQQQQEQNQSQQQDQQQSEQQQQQQQQQKQDAFGNMKDQQSEQKPEPQKQPPQKPQGGTQKVGGKKDNPEQAPLDPEMAVPLQKLQQVKDLDSPAKLQLLMQGQQQRPAKPAKDW
jgi:Ca-activated chloride channel homolog